MGLGEYRRKRNFKKTAEPVGGASADDQPAFVVQKHDASHLHYDFRLEHAGVLWSWAVPKGPSLDPAEKRLAVQVEDHPLDYRHFEGIIPAGEYGAGSVMVWDEGIWEPVGDPAAGFREGRLQFLLHGKKLHGRWTLVRMDGKRFASSTKPQWLLMKSQDQFACPLAQNDILSSAPNSAVSGRTLEQIAAGQAAKRKPVRRTQASADHSRAGSRNFSRERSTRSQSRRKPNVGASKKSLPAGSHRSPIPAHPQVQLATLVQRAPSGKGWLHECKFDGYRMLCRRDGDDIRFISRNENDWTDRLQSLVPEMEKLPVDSILLDGEVVVLDRKGVSDFQALQNALGGEQPARLYYYVFDLLYLDGFDITQTPLRERKRILQSLLKKADKSSSLRFSKHLTGSAAEISQHACQAGLEGIVSKRADAPYRPGRGTDWVKSKCRKGQEFVIGGYTRPAGSRAEFGALLVGYYRPDGKLAYAGRVGTGFDRSTLQSLAGQMHKYEQRKAPFADLPRGTAVRGVHWLKPRLVADVEFNNWTNDGLLRQAAFHGLREDKPPQAIIREQPVKTD